MANLTADAFQRLLARMDADSLKAAEKYEELRLKLTKCLVWKGCRASRADALADIVFDRLAGKLEKNVAIENLDAYAYQVLRFVWLEHRRKNMEDECENDKMPEIAASAPIYLEEPDHRLNCLRACLNETARDAEDRRLLLDYYDSDDAEKIKNRRKSLAERLGINTNALKVKMFRARERLEKCVNECVRRRLRS